MKRKTNAEMRGMLVKEVKAHPTNLTAVFKMVAFKTGYSPNGVRDNYYRMRGDTPMFMIVTPDGIAINQKRNQVKAGGKKKLVLDTEVISMKELPTDAKATFVDLMFEDMRT